MALLNLILLPLLALLGLFETNGAPGGGDASAAGDPPADGGAKPAAKPADAAKPDKGPAGGVEALRADLASERDRRQQLESEIEELRPLRTRLEELEQANQTENEKAINEAKKAGAAEVRQQYEGQVRQARVYAALLEAGMSGKAAETLSESRRWDSLKVDGLKVEGLDQAVAALKTADPTLFTARVPGGSIDQGAQPDSDKPRTYEEAVTAHYASRPGAN